MSYEDSAISFANLPNIPPAKFYKSNCCSPFQCLILCSKKKPLTIKNWQKQDFNQFKFYVVGKMCFTYHQDLWGIYAYENIILDSSQLIPLKTLLHAVHGSVGCNICIRYIKAKKTHLGNVHRCNKNSFRLDFQVTNLSQVHFVTFWLSSLLSDKSRIQKFTVQRKDVQKKNEVCFRFENEQVLFQTMRSGLDSNHYLWLV